MWPVLNGVFVVQTLLDSIDCFEWTCSGVILEGQLRDLVCFAGYSRKRHSSGVKDVCIPVYVFHMFDT